ncbi:MAG: DUF2971 domain-containing protein [Spirochaetia bacterium]|nr:DUF2971 domain-containing protein [Spirochaetia bacterium]
MCKKFYKYKSFTDENGNDVSLWTLDSLANKYFYFSRPEQLNDPIDCRVFNEYEVEDKDIQNWIDRKPSREKFTVESIRAQLNTNKFQRTMEERARKDEQHFHVLSLTDNWNNSHMWERYANQYEGICIGYASTFCDDCDYIKAVEIVGNLPILKSSFRNVEGEAFFELQKVQYDNNGEYKYNIFKSLDKNNKEAIEYALLHKTKKWSNENEYRKIIMDTLNSCSPHDFTPKDLRVFYPDTVLSEICFGYKCDLEKRKQVFNCIKECYSNWKDIHFYNVKQEQPDGILEREEVFY